MQVGFTMLEAGFCRSRETVNVLMECIVDTCLCGLLFYAFGFAFMFSGTVFDGSGYLLVFPQGARWRFTENHRGRIPGFLDFPIFAFADTLLVPPSPREVMIGRTRIRRRSRWYSVAVSGFIYPIIGHWAWGPDGFLAMMGSAGNFLPWVGTSFHDFAGFNRRPHRSE